MLTPQPSSIAAMARAFATYSLVPYLGIVFCPGAVLVGGFGIVRHRAGGSDKKVCYLSVLVGVLVLVIQLLLWWILYKVPIWAKGAP